MAETLKKPGLPELKENLDAFEREKPRLLSEHRGKFALFHRGKFIDSFSTFQLAYEAGVERFGLDPFMIEQISEENRVYEVPILSLGILRADVQ